MEQIHINATKDSPEINLNSSTNTIDILGVSYPEDTFEFYKPIKVWLTNYFKGQTDEVTINIDLSYMNSSSFKVFFEIFEIFEEAYENNTKLTINWIYDEDNDIALEIGEDFVDDFSVLNINLVSKIGVK